MWLIVVALLIAVVQNQFKTVSDAASYVCVHIGIFYRLSAGGICLYIFSIPCIFMESIPERFKLIPILLGIHFMLMTYLTVPALRLSRLSSLTGGYGSLVDNSLKASAYNFVDRKMSDYGRISRNIRWLDEMMSPVAKGTIERYSDLSELRTLNSIVRGDTFGREYWDAHGRVEFLYNKYFLDGSC